MTLAKEPHAIVVLLQRVSVTQTLMHPPLFLPTFASYAVWITLQEPTGEMGQHSLPLLRFSLQGKFPQEIPEGEEGSGAREFNVR